MDIVLTGPGRDQISSTGNCGVPPAPTPNFHACRAVSTMASTAALADTRLVGHLGGPIHVEVCQRPDSVEPREAVRAAVGTLLARLGRVYHDFSETRFDDAYLQANVELIAVGDLRSQCPTAYEVGGRYCRIGGPSFCMGR